MTEWWRDLDDAVLACLGDNRAMAPGDIGRSIGMSEDAVISLLAMLAHERKIRICLVEGHPTIRGRRHQAA